MFGVGENARSSLYWMMLIMDGWDDDDVWVVVLDRDAGLRAIWYATKQTLYLVVNCYLLLLDCYQVWRNLSQCRLHACVSFTR